MSPEFLRPYLASYDLQELDLRRDKELIITGILNKGNGKALRWLGKTYSQKEIKRIISSPIRGMWLENILVYWQKIFKIKLKPKVFKEAILDLRP